MASFTLRSGNYTIKLDTVSLTSVAGGGAPKGYEIVTFSILDPYSRHFNTPTQQTPSSAYSISPLSNAFTTYVDSNGNTYGDLSNGDGQLFLQLPPGKYSSVLSVQGALHPTTVPPTTLYLANSINQQLYVAGMHPVYEYLSISVFPYFDWPPGGVLPEVVSCTPTTLVMSADIKDNNGGIGLSGEPTLTLYRTQATDDHMFCRYTGDETSIAGHTIAASLHSGTFNDGFNTPPAAMFKINSPLSGTTFDIEFALGGPADFPVGQRLRVCREIVDLKQTTPDLGDFSEDVLGSGIIKIDLREPAAWRDMSYPPADLHILEECDPPLLPTLGAWAQRYEDTPNNMIYTGFITLELA